MFFRVRISNPQKGRLDLRLVSTCKYFEKTEEGEPSSMFVMFLNITISCVFTVLLVYMHLLFE